MKHMRLTIRHWMLGLMALTCSAALSAAPANFATTAPIGYWLEVETVTPTLVENWLAKPPTGCT